MSKPSRRSEVVDRVARAVFAVHNRDPDWKDGCQTAEETDIRSDSDLSHEECFSIARAAIAAMREPTEPIPFEATVYNDGPYARQEVRRIWQAMIDAALGGEG